MQMVAAVLRERKSAPEVAEAFRRAFTAASEQKLRRRIWEASVPRDLALPQF